ncbi:membrane protein BRI3 [Linepithema humile]|uniref:membrane protein BRI3 n=1 Tax=Linepithema humile TaxID=83485 RepID=UPI0006239BF5|nr:PREDICTED: brain protein I3 [Linepithema humile]
METQPLKTPEKHTEKPPPYSVATAPTVNTAWQPPPGYYPSNTNAGPYVHSYAGSNVGPNVNSNVGNQGNYVPSYGSTHSTAIIVPEIILVGGCPACRVGVMEDDYTCLGLLCAILFFPFGILCCMLLKTRRCSNCGAYFG